MNTETAVLNHRQALNAVRSELKTRFLERDEIIDALIIALLSKQHILLLGPPGTAKSALVEEVCKSISGASLFQWLLTKFSTPEEIFGPISLAALQQDKFSRITTSKLPQAHVAFCDEIFKANSAILNAMLTLINERLFYNNGQAETCPLVTMVGASNELPEGAELEALFDRFLLRFWIHYLGDAHDVRSLLTNNPPVRTATLTLEQLAACQAGASLVGVPDFVIDAVIGIKNKAEQSGFVASDRRWKQTITALKAAAYLAGQSEVGEDQLEILPDMLWREPKDRPAVASIVSSVGNPVNIKASEILDAAKEALQNLGTPARDASEKAEWLKQASLAESRLSTMEAELSTLVSQHPPARTKRAGEVLSQVQRMKQDITRRVAALYNL